MDFQPNQNQTPSSLEQGSASMAFASLAFGIKLYLYQAVPRSASSTPSTPFYCLVAAFRAAENCLLSHIFSYAEAVLFKNCI